MSNSPAAPKRRRTPWPAFFAFLLVFVNCVALGMLYAEVSYHLDGVPSYRMVHEGFLAFTKLNLLLGVLLMLSIVRQNAVLRREALHHLAE